MTFTTDMKINKVEGLGNHLISVNLFCVVSGEVKSDFCILWIMGVQVCTCLVAIHFVKKIFKLSHLADHAQIPSTPHLCDTWKGIPDFKVILFWNPACKSCYWT